MRVACEAVPTSTRPVSLPFDILSAFFPSLCRVFSSLSTPLTTGYSPRRPRIAWCPPLPSPSPPGISLGRPMRLASAPRALRLLDAIGFRRAFPCHSVVGVTSFRAFYNVGRRAAPSVRPLRRGRVPRCLVPRLTRATRLGRLPPYA